MAARGALLLLLLPPPPPPRRRLPMHACGPSGEGADGRSGSECAGSERHFLPTVPLAGHREHREGASSAPAAPSR